MKEFFGFGGYTRVPEGYMSWQHILFVSLFMAAMVTLAVTLGNRYKNKTYTQKNRVLIVTAILIDSCEIFKIVIECIRESSLSPILLNLPLFLCSVQLITIPLAAFSHGKLKEAALDFVFIFGLLGAVLGTIGAGNIYSSYPVLSFDATVSAITHSISGFATIYIGISGTTSMKKRGIISVFYILFAFSSMAYIVNRLINYNYMFLMRGDGTPYDIFYKMVGGNPIIYPILVVALFVGYILAFYGVRFLILDKKAHDNGAYERSHGLIEKRG